MRLTDNQLKIKAAVRYAVEKAGGNALASERIHVPGSDLSLWCSDNSNRYIPLDHAIDLDRAAGQPIIMRTMARISGVDVVTPEEKTELAGSVHKIVGMLARATGELESAALDANEDGSISPNEDKTIRRHCALVRDVVDHIETATSKLRVV